MASRIKVHGDNYLSKYKPVVLLVTLILTGLFTGWAVGQQPILVVAGFSAAVLAVTMLLWPDLATMAVIFILYTNIAVVAVKFHGIPYFMGAALPGLLAIPFAGYLIFKRQKLIVDPVFPLLLIYLAVQLISALFSNHVDTALDEIFVFLVEWLALYFLIVNTIRTPAMLRRVVWVLVFAGMIMGGIPLIQQITGTFDNNYGGLAQVTDASFRVGEATFLNEVRQPRLAGPIGEKNYYSQIILMLVPLGLSRFWGEKSLFLRLLGFIGAVIAGAGMVLAFSRGAAVGFALMVLILVLLRLIKPYQVGLIILIAGLLLVAVPQYTLRLVSLQSIMELFADDNEIATTDRAITGRATEMLAAFNVFRDYPILGVGPGQFKYYSKEYSDELGLVMLTGTRESHSLYLGIAADTGALGLLSFLAILFMTFRNLARTRHRFMHSHPDISNMATSFMLVLLTFMTTGIFLHLSYMRFFGLMLALANVASLVRPEEAAVQNPWTFRKKVLVVSNNDLKEVPA